MSLPFGGLHLGSLPLLSNAKTRSISAENPTGAVGGGATAEPDANNPSSALGRGWKGRACLMDLPVDSVTTLAEIEGPGVIQHIWITVDPKRLREIVIRFYWDGETEPSIECPLGDFFCLGNSQPTLVNSLPVAVNSNGGLNCYWPMPFRKSAKITIENNHQKEPLSGFFYQVTYALQDVPADAAYLHAQWRRARTTRDNPQHVLVDTIKGAGHYVGTYLLWVTTSDIWWGEGEIKFFIDGDGEFPTICGTGTEDYFGGAWGFYGQSQHEERYSTPFLGLPLVEHVPHKVPKFGMYRWHIMDPIRFEKDLKVTIQALGWYPNGKFQPLEDDISSVAYWYQTEPHQAHPPMPGVDARYAR